MNKIYVQWEKCRYYNLSDYDNTYFYAFSRKEELLYIGMTYYQDVIEEIGQTLNAFQCNKHSIDIWLGYISSTYKRISSQIIKETESTLINANQPFWNTQEKKSYDTRNNLKITSKGCWLLSSTIVCINDELQAY